MYVRLDLILIKPEILPASRWSTVTCLAAELCPRLSAAGPAAESA